MLPRRCQLADVVIYSRAPSVEAASELAAVTLAELTGCVLVAAEVTGQGVLLAARPDQRALTPPGDVTQVAVAAYESLLRGNGVLVSRSAISAAFGSPLLE